jgi:CDP-diacylglycerol pyrophosphatase
LEPFIHRGTRAILFAALFTLALSASAGAAQKSRDIIWDIVSNCLDPAAPDYCDKCRWPRTETTCAKGLTCLQTTEVWAENDAYVILRDPKMCGCPENFVHGLAIPRTRVTGVEDPRHPDSIWAFAWETALQRIGDPRVAALVVNPPWSRAQDQLHVHIVRLKEYARNNFCSNFITRVPSLDQVWSEAAKLADSAGVSDYGILVTSHPEGGFIVLIDRKSPEKEYVQEGCKVSESRPPLPGPLPESTESPRR